MRTDRGPSIRRLARCLCAPASTVGRAVRPPVGPPETSRHRRRPVSGDPGLVGKVKSLCKEHRHRTYGYRRIRALIRKRHGIVVGKKAVRRIMRDEGLLQPKLRFKQARPPHVERMVADCPNQGWQVDMTSFVLSDLSTLYLVVVMDCFTRKIVGWNLDNRCRAREWIAAVRMGLESQKISADSGLTIRSDNGAQPCSAQFVSFLRKSGVSGQYTGYNAPDDNAFVERVIRTIKEEEIWPNVYDRWSEAHQAVEQYIDFYNRERIHSALEYKSPLEFENDFFTRKAA